MRFVAVQRRGDDPVVQGQGRLDEPRDAAGRHGVTDVRLHRAEAHGREHGPVVALEDVAQGGDLDAVAGPGRRAVRFDQPDARRIEVRGVPGPLDGQHLSLAGRAHQRGGPSVARDAGPPDRGVHPVAVAAGVGQPLEHHDPGPLPDEDAVCALVERADHAAGAERLELREHAPQRHVVAVVDAAGEHEVRPPRLELGHRLRHGEERRGAGGIEGVRRALEVEPVGDQGRDEVGHQPDRRLGVRRAERLLELVADGVEPIVAQVGHQLAHARHELVGGADPLLEARRGRREVAAPPDHHPDPAGVGHALDVAGVGQGPRRGGQGQELVGLGARGRHGHDAEVGRVERHRRVDEPAPPAVEAVWSGRARFEEHRVDAVGRHVADGVDAGDQVVPERCEVGGAGEDPRHPDDGDRLGRHVRPRAIRARRTWRPPGARGRRRAARRAPPPPRRRGR